MTATVRETFERALGAIPARFFVSNGRSQAHTIAVAYSGGLDSTVLLYLAHAYATADGRQLFAFHIHHGLSPSADRWLDHCQSQCQKLGVQFEARRENVEASGEGIEQAARAVRYRALGSMCAQHDVRLLLTAHHQDDQAETVLLQLLRGAGVAGLAGMAPQNTAPGLLGQGETWIVRPLLDLTRTQLEQWAREHGLAWIEDESNADHRYTRNRLRHSVMPVFEQAFPGYQQRFARSARHARAIRQLLDELADEDLQRCAVDGAVALDALRDMSEARVDNLLRRWFARHEVRMPSTAWLSQMRAQVFSAHDDARVQVTHPDCEVWRYRGRLILAPRVDDAVFASQPVDVCWSGEETIAFPAFGGRLCFESAGEGLDPQWLRTHMLTLRHRSGGERLKLGLNRPSRSLKHHFQALGVPPWERLRLPLIEANGQLLFVAGIGLNHAQGLPFSAPGIGLRWIPDTCVDLRFCGAAGKLTG